MRSSKRGRFKQEGYLLADAVASYCVDFFSRSRGKTRDANDYAFHSNGQIDET